MRSTFYLERIYGHKAYDGRTTRDPAVLLYRAEKEKRAGRTDPRLAEAKIELDERAARDRAKRKGGRPKKVAS